MSTEFHGVEGNFESDNVDELTKKAPRRPATGNERPTQGHEKTWPRVYFRGFHGAGQLNCDNFREFTKLNVPSSKVDDIAWAAFGLCNHQVVCYDDLGVERVLSKKGDIP